MKKIIIILPRGEAIKNFVYSGIVDTLRKNFQIVFFSVVPNEELKKYLENKCDEFYELSEEKLPSKFSKEIKHVLQIAHAKDLNSVTGNLKILKDDVSSNKNFTSRTIRKIRKRLATFYKTKESLVRLTNFYIKKQFQKRAVKDYEALLKKIQPDFIFNTSHIHNSISLDLMYAAKKCKLKTGTFLFSWDNLTSQGRILPDYDYYITWNEKIKQDLSSIYPSIKPKNVFVTGTPQFDFHFKKEFILDKEDLYAKLGIESNKKIVLYSTGMAYYTPKESKIVEEIDKKIKEVDENLQLVVRIYAKDDNTDYYQLRERNKRIIIPDHLWELNHLTPTYEDIQLFTSLVYHCAIGINVASTVSLDLAIHDKPVINIAFNPPNEDIYPNDYLKIYEFDHYKPIVESGAISLAKSPDELESILRKYNKEPKTDSELRKKLILKFLGEHLRNDKSEAFSKVFNQILD